MLEIKANCAVSKMGSLRFDGRVVVVTGAGAGLGRAYALLFGSRGAKVVVNDLGGGRHGDGSSTKAADAVVNEIRRAGGEAVADYNSVVDGEKIIKTALDNFGRVDVLVNNAGILRDKSFARISDQDWDLIHNVHLKGSFKTTQAAWPIFKKQNYGRIIMTSSNSGLYGNFGQANYSAAKMGLVGLSNTVAIEGARNNIHCNVIVPTAASRLTEDILPPDVFGELKPEFIAPIVAYLCHESCTENGSIIDSALGWAGKCHLIRANGVQLRSNLKSNVTIENVRDMWDKITDMSGAQRMDSIQTVTGELINSLPGSETSAKSGEKYSFGFKDLILYALAVGASLADEDDLRYLYENHESFGPIPSYFVIPALINFMSSDSLENLVPGKTVSLANILHGEQYLEILGELPVDGTLESRFKISEVLDKGSGAAIVADVESYNESGELCVRNQIVAFAVGAGGSGGPRTGKTIVPCVAKPSRAPDVIVSQKTSIDQAAIYRLCGDLNPLHIDPSMAAMGGFDRPILHGLCSLGFSVRTVIKSFASNDASLFKAVKARFVKPVLPGQTLKISMWQENNRIYFETSVVENNSVVISGAYIDLKAVRMQPNMKNVSAHNLQSDAVFGAICDRVKADPVKAKSINAVYLYNITKGGKQVKQWTMDLKNAEIYEGAPKSGKPNTTLTVSDDDFVQMALGKLNPQAAFMKGKLKVAGNVMLAQKLAPLLKTEAKL